MLDNFSMGHAADWCGAPSSQSFPTMQVTAPQILLFWRVTPAKANESGLTCEPAARSRCSAPAQSRVGILLVFRFAPEGFRADSEPAVSWDQALWRCRVDPLPAGTDGL